MENLEAANLIRREIELYRDVSLFSMKDHHQAIQCVDFQDLLERGILAFKAICRLDESCRHGVFTEKFEYDPEQDELIETLYRIWNEPCKDVLEKLDHFEQSGFQVDHAREFRACYREVRGVLTADEDFFKDDALVKLRDAAMDEHERGETNEHSV